MSRSYVTAARVSEIEQRLTPLDQQLLADVARLNVVTAGQLRRLHYADSDTGRRYARRDLQRLVEWRVLARLDRRIGGIRAGSEGFAMTLDVIGQRLRYPQRRRYRPPWTPQPTHLLHAVAVSELYVQLCTDTTLSVEFVAEPACWRQSAGSLVLKPDAYVEITTDEFRDAYFIEIDRATESMTRIAEKLTKGYVRHWQTGREQEANGVFPLVVWVTPNEARASQIRGVIGRLGADHRQLFVVTTVDAAAPQLTNGTLLSLTTKEVK
jgi:hypothetical protein